MKKAKKISLILGVVALTVILVGTMKVIDPPYGLIHILGL